MDPTERKITKIAREAGKFTVQAMKEEGIGTAEFDFIHLVRHHPGITQTEVREQLKIDKGAAARRAASLEAKGYLIRKPNPWDGRSQLLYATEKAETGNIENKYQIKINNFYFPTKSYGDISLPAGYYDALRVEIGNAKGKNWWCVMFPSLCFIDISSGIVDSEGKEKLENNLDSESYELISESKTSTEFKLKFKLLEVFSHNGLFTAKN